MRIFIYWIFVALSVSNLSVVDLHDGDEGEEDDRHHQPGHDGMHAAALHGNIYIAIRFGERNIVIYKKTS